VRLVALATLPDAAMLTVTADADGIAELLSGQSDCKGDFCAVGMQLGFTCSLNYSEAIASERKEGGGTALSCTLSSPDIFMDLSLPLLLSV
jgi:hypothetical protein